MKNQLLIAIIFIATLASCTRVDAGHEGILVKQYGTDKGVQDVNLVTGRVWYNPWTEDVYEIPTFVQTLDYNAFDVNAKDGSSFTVDPTLSFAVIAGHSPSIFKKYRKDLEEVAQTTLFNYVKDAFRLQMNKYTTDEIVSNREQFENDVQKSLSKALELEGFHLEQLTSGLKYPSTIVNAINDKNKAVQQAMESRNKLVRDSIEAQRTIIVARAQKEAYELKMRSLTPLLVQQQFVEKWDGKTPLYGNAPVLFKPVQ